MDNQNKELVKQAQQIMKEYGYEVKTSHLYEMFAKLAGHKSWNVASAKKADLSEVIKQFLPVLVVNPFELEFMTQIMQSDLSNKLSHIKEENLNTLIDKNINDGVFKNKFVLGIKEDPITKEASWNLKDFTKEAHALFVGHMGSGKSSACMFTATTWLAANQKNTEVFLVDTIKKGSDYRPLFDIVLSQHVRSYESFQTLINVLYEDVYTRAQTLHDAKAKNIFEYNEKNETPLKTVIVIVEEFHDIFTNMKYITGQEFMQNSTAHKFLAVLNAGKNCGCYFLASTQKSTASDIPQIFLDKFANKQVFKSSKTEAQYTLGHNKDYIKVSEITSTQKGRCIDGNNVIQYPYYDPDTVLLMLVKVLQ